MITYPTGAPAKPAGEPTKKDTRCTAHTARVQGSPRGDAIQPLSHRSPFTYTDAVPTHFLRCIFEMIFEGLRGSATDLCILAALQ